MSLVSHSIECHQLESILDGNPLVRNQFLYALQLGRVLGLACDLLLQLRDLKKISLEENIFLFFQNPH